MSDAKPRRGTREAARHEVARSEAAPAESPPMIAPELPVPTAEPESAPVIAVAGAIAPGIVASQDAWATLAAAQVALARGLEAVAAEITGMTRSGFAASSDAAIALLGATTFAEIVEINAGLARRGVDAIVESSARLSEIAATAATEASRPLLSRVGAPWVMADAG